MADEEEVPDEELDGEEGEEGGKKKLTGKVIVLYIAAPILGLLLLGGGALMFFGGGDEHAEGGEAGEHAVDENFLDPTQVVFYDLPELLVNITSDNSRTAFLKLQISLELSKDEDLDVLQAALPRVIDKFQVYLHELRMNDLSGASGTQRVKEELLRRVNIAAQPVQVNAVLIKEMIVQ